MSVTSTGDAFRALQGIPTQPTISSASTWQEARNPARTWLPDPIVAEEQNTHLVPMDQALRLNPLQKAGLWAEQTFVALPKAVVKGLKGDPDYSFSDFLHVAKIPYYLGGTLLTLSFLAGRDKVNTVRQGMGVLLYYLGVGSANTLINGLTQWRTGVDLNLRYRNADGKVEKVFASADFPRLDLLSRQDYEKIKDKMGIPPTIADPVGETNREIKEVISTSRANKLIVGNLLAAVGAGYIARSDGWARLLGKQGTLRTVLLSKEGGSPLQRAKNAVTTLGAYLEKGVQEKFTGMLTGPAQKVRVAALATMLGALVYGLFQSVRPVTDKHFEESKIAAGPLLNKPKAGPDTPFRSFQAARLGYQGGSNL